MQQNRSAHLVILRISDVLTLVFSILGLSYIFDLSDATLS